MAGITATYVSTTSFTVVGDTTDEFNEGRRVRLTATSGFLYGTVVSSSYSDPNTTVILAADSDDLDNTITLAYYGVAADSLGTLPEHTHNGTQGEGGLLSKEHVNFRAPNSFYLKDLLIYYGYPSSFNYPDNSYQVEDVAKDMARYNMIVFGNGIANTGHADYANFITIVDRLKELKPNILLFGYVSSNQSQANFETKVDELAAVSSIDGIFMDEAGYDFDVDRGEFNTEVGYVHASNCPICFVNAWNMNHVIGVENDASYPNVTYNPTSVASNLTRDDWFLIESYPVNTEEYESGNDGYCSMYDWLARGNKCISNREEFGIHLASVSIIDKDDEDAEIFFRFHYLTALTFALEAHGTSHNAYGSGVPIIPFYRRLDWGHMGLTYEDKPSVTVATDNWQKHLRYTDKGKILCDYTGADPFITFVNNIDSFGANALTKLSSTTVAFDSATATTLYIVPAGKLFVPVMIIIRAGANAALTDVTFGRSTAKTDFLGTTQLDNLDASGDIVLLMPVPQDPALKLKAYAAGLLFQIDVTVANGGATNEVDLFGYLIDV